MKYTIALSIVGIASLAGIFLSRSEAPVTESESIQTKCERCNVIVIGLDAWQAAHVHHLGYARETTPNLDAVARRGVTFTQALSASSWTVPSYMSVHTSAFPSEHKVTNKFVSFSEGAGVFSDLRQLSPEMKTLAEVFAENGYRTAGFTGDAGVSGRFGYAKGFEVYIDDVPFGGFERNLEQALEWAQGNAAREEPFFMFFHGYDAHGQFALPARYEGEFMPTDYDGPFRGTPQEQEVLRERGLAGEPLGVSESDIEFWRAWYDSKIRDADARLGEFMKGLENRGLLSNTILVFVGDHGTEFFEHGAMDHGHALYDELVRVPLVLVLPQQVGKVVEEQVSTLDVFPTVLEVTGIQTDESLATQIRGQSLLPHITGQASGRDIYLETDYRNYVHARGVRTVDGFKYVRFLGSDKEELYDLTSDPGETQNVVTERPDVLARVRLQLDEHLTRIGIPEFGDDCLPVYDSQCK